MNKETGNIKRSYKGWIIALIVLVILVISGRYFLKSDWLFNKAREMVIERANQKIHGDLSIGSIRGDLLNGFMIHDVNVQDSHKNEVGQIDSIDINYNFFEALFSPHTIESVKIFGTDLFVEQYPDSSWNLLQLLPTPQPQSKESEPLYWYIENLDLSNANIEIQSEYLLPDDSMSVNRANANLSVGMLESGISANLRELGFSIQEGHLPEPVDVYLAGAARQNQYTLDSIVISTGRSILKGSAQYEEGGEIEQNLHFSPLSWRDIAEFVSKTPVEQNLQVDLSAEGTLDNLRLTLNASADGLSQFQLQVTSSLKEPLALRDLRVTAKELNVPLLTGLENSPVIQSIDLQGEGSILFQALGESNWEGSLSIENASYQQYSLNLFNTSYTFQDSSLDIEGTLANQNEDISMKASIDSMLGERPEWEIHASSNQLNPQNWLQNEKFAGSLNIKLDALGSGFDPSDFSGSTDIIITDSEFHGQAFSEAQFSGSFNQDRVIGQLIAQLRESHANMDFTLNNWQSTPQYEFDMQMNRLNMAELNGLEDFPTYLNGSVEGHGSSFDPEQLTMMATANFDSSIVNGEEIQELNTDLRIENQFLIIDEGALQSPIADASFSLYHHLYDITNHTNRLNFEASIKDPSSLAPLFGVEKLDSQGSVSGNLGRNAEGTLEFNGIIELKNVAVDTLFSAEEISGTISSYILDEPEIDLNIELSEPSIYQKSVQDMEVYLYAKKREYDTIGNISLNITNGNNSSLRHSGEFVIDSTMTTLHTQSLEFETNLRALTLEYPFKTTYSNGTVSIDTLSITSDQGDAHLKLWAPRIDSLSQQGGLDAQNLNIGVLQETILKESYFEGFLNGSAQIHNTPDSMDVSAVGYLTDLRLAEGEMDSLKINLDIREEWLTAQLESWHQNNKLAEGSFRVPFLPGDPHTFDDQFFEREVDGQFQVYESQLSYWLSFLPEGVPESTSGTVRFESQLGGIAGKPDLEGKLTISEGVFSGITVDTVGVDLAYLHENERLDINGTIEKDQREIFDFESSAPFLIDLRNSQINWPSGDDEIFVDLKTNNFDLALLNSYVNRDQIRGIAGRVEGAVTLKGPMDNLQAQGDMQLVKGSFRAPQAGITVSDISSNIAFRQETIELERFTAHSGPGRIRASGSVNMQSLDPGQMNIKVTANQFQLLNTSDYKALINLDATLSGTASEPQLEGSLRFLNGYYFLQDFGERSVEDVELEDESNEEDSYDFYEALNMEMTVGIDRQFYIRNRQYLDMEIELDGEVDVVKEPNQDIQIFGSLQGVEGYARPLGKEFKLKEALVTFYGPPKNPELNIRSSYSPPQSAGVTIFYIIEGTLQKPDFRFDSQPPLELQDMISYTLFGRPFYELESWEQVVAGSGNNPSAYDYALEVVLDRVEMLASRRLGIDVVQIDNSRSGSNNTVIKTGWYLNRNTFFAILNEIDGSNPKTLFTLEIMLKENLDLIITQGDDTRQGIDLQWKRDY